MPLLAYLLGFGQDCRENIQTLRGRNNKGIIMKKIFCSTLFCLALAGANTANAAAFTFDGNIANHNDIVTINFSLINDANNVKVWTDSFQSATNFDPITALWNKTTGALIAQNDDNASIAPGQTWYDSGFALDFLEAGDYLFTVATYPNFAQGSNIFDGFQLDGQTPIPLSQWTQPANGFNMGTYWRVNLEGVDSANVSAVPVPAAVWLFGSGLMGLLGFNRKRAQSLAA
jgi:hypothetical protein